MNRRDFLLFKTEGRTKTVELSCERLYMLYVDTRNTPTAEPPEAYDGEPPARFEIRSAQQLFDDVSRDLDGIDIVRITHTEWLADADFKREVDGLIAAVQRRGGRVEAR
jgi:hypothetical protein